ncbi:MAG: hypothetical protein HZA64_11600 [Rhodocyclales bacterium]|nr:hypothetical protein [Rhodocyclales bacterium]
MKRLELESLLADRESVMSMLATLTDRDPIGRISFSARLAAIEEEIGRLQDQHETTGSVALMFSGDPVFGARSIGADFSASVLRSFQDLISKQISSEEFGRLGARGRVPERTSSALSIRELVRGSVGFVLEETAQDAKLVDTPIKQAIDDVTVVITQAAAESDEEFEASIETLDPRMLVSLRDFFRTLDDGGAAVRIVEEDRDAALDFQAVRRARNRVDATDVQDTESDTVVGELLGLLPDSRRFEMKLLESGEVIRGTVAASLATQWLELIELPDEKLIGQFWRTRMKIREVRERNRPPRRLYSLLGLLERRS